MQYFIDNQIYFQGKQQPPRRVPVYDLKLAQGKAYFHDREGNHYTLAENEIFEDTITEEKFSIELYIGSVWICNGLKDIILYQRLSNGDFKELITIPYSQQENLDSAVMQKLKEKGYDPDLLFK